MIDEDAAWVADVFAAQAAATLGQVRELDGLRQAMETREVIGQAMGMIMMRYRLDAPAAFAFLVRVSTRSNIKLRDVARHMIAEHRRLIDQQRGSSS